ncbi:MAG: DUF4058 family protein [Gemmataceae bacterium]
MPLLDHFRPPMTDIVDWETFHAAWAHETMRHLHEAVLPPRYAARTFVHFGRQIEVDVAAVENSPNAEPGRAGSNGHGGAAVLAAPAIYTPPSPPLSAVATVAAEGQVEIQVRKNVGGWKLVAAIELVSESNKDRPAHRRAFAIKCASYLQAGVAVVVVDTVTSYRAELHAELTGLLRLPEVFDWESPTGLSAVSYRTVEGLGDAALQTGDGRVRLDVWPFPLAVGAELPTVPLWLAADLAVPLELELTYAAACKSLRLG